MLYLIGGPPRCGKSELALHLCRTRGLPFVSTDVLWGVLEVAHPAWRTPMAKGAERIPAAAEMFNPYLVQLLGLLESTAPDFVVEGELIIPSHIPSLSASLPLRSVFLVRSRTSSQQLVDPPGRNAWLSQAPPALLEAVADEVRGHSTSVAHECNDLRLPCVDVAPDLAAAMREAEELLGLV